MIFAVDYTLCDVWKGKNQILIAHQKEEIDRTKKSFLVGQKKYSLGLDDFAHDFGKLTTPYVMFEREKLKFLLLIRRKK